MTLEIVAVLISLRGDVLSLVELEKFSDMKSCQEYAKMEKDAVMRQGNAGVGCAQYMEDGALEIKIFGRLRK